MSFAKRFRPYTILFFCASLIVAQNRDEVIQLVYPVFGVTLDTNFVDVEITVADFFTLGTPGCTDCDGYVQLIMDGAVAGQFTSVTPVTVTGLAEGSHFIEIEALDPSGISFTPTVYDSGTFVVDMASVLNLCPPLSFSVMAGDSRNLLEWSEPLAFSNLNPFPAVPQSADYHTGTTNSIAFTESSLIKAHGGSADDKEAGWAIFNLVGMRPNVEVDSIVFHYYVNNTDWPYWSATAVYIDPLTASPGDVHTEILAGTGPTEAYLYQSESSTFAPGWYANTLLNSANDDLENAIPQGFFVIGVTDRDGSDTYYLDLDGWNEANPPSLEIHWSTPGGTRGVYSAPAISSIPYTEAEIMSYKNAISEGLDVPATLAGISAYERVRTPSLFSTREVIENCGDLQNYTIYSADSSVIVTLDTTYYIHENLTNGTEYCYYIVANYTEGSSNATATECATPAVFNPLPVTNLSATPLHEEVALSWTDPNTPSYTYYSSFEGSDDGFSADGDFERGTPLSGPDGAASGSECFGTNLSGPYSNNSISFLTSPSYSLAGLVNPVMQISQWYYIEGFYDGGNVKISGDEGMTWSILTPVDDYPEDAVSTANANIPGEPAFSGTTGGDNWHTVQFDLSSYADSTVMFRFDFGSDGSVTYDGWFIDDFAIFDNPTGREVDGDLLGYNIYLDGVMIMDSVEATGYLVTGLTNTTMYTFGVSASYFPTYESDIVNVSATPTWLYGDVSGTITDPNGSPLDSAIVQSGDIVDTTDAGGAYFLNNLEPGLNTIMVQRQNFENGVADVTVIAQATAVVQDFVLAPVLPRPGGLGATAGDAQVDLVWRKPGAGGSYDLAYYDEIFESQIGCGTTCEFGVRFTPLGYPATLTTVYLSFQGDASAVAANVIAYIDENGSVVGPGVLPAITLAENIDLSSPDGSLVQYEIDVSAADIVVNSGDIYIIAAENSSGFMGIANDIDPQSPEYYDRNWVSLTAGEYTTIFDAVGGVPTLTGDFGVMATFDGPSFVAVTLNNHNQPVVQLDRISEGTYTGEISTTMVATEFDPKAAVGYERTTNPENVLRLTDTRLPEPLARTLQDSLIGYNIYQVMDTGDSLVATNNDPDDTTATISVASNYTEYCFNVRAIWNTDEYGILESKASGDACAIPFRPGDVDFNDIVDIADLLTVVNFVLEAAAPTGEQFRGADVNMDTTITINDVVLIVDIIFGDQNARYTEQPDVPVQAALLRADRQLLVNMDYPGVTRGIQFTLSVGAGLELGPVQTAVDVAGIMAVSRQNAAGELMVVVFNNAGGTVEQDGSTVIRIPFQFKGGQDKATVELTDFQVAGMLGEVLPVTIGEKRVEISILPDVFALHQNYPNPFNPVTEIRIDVPETSPVTLTIYNIMGQEVATVLDGQLDGGIHRVRWNGTNNLGETVGTGVYFYRLSAPTFTSTKKMIMMK